MFTLSLHSGTLTRDLGCSHHGRRAYRAVPVSPRLRGARLRSLLAESGFYPQASCVQCSTTCAPSAETILRDLLPGTSHAHTRWLFTPWPASEERVARHLPFGPPPTFPSASTCAGQDRMVSRFCSVARRGGTTRFPTEPVPPGDAGRSPHPSPGASLFGCERSVSLCHGRLCGLNSPRPRTPQPVIRDGTRNIAARASERPCDLFLVPGCAFMLRGN